MMRKKSTKSKENLMTTIFHTNDGLQLNAYFNYKRKISLRWEIANRWFFVVISYIQVPRLPPVQCMKPIIVLTNGVWRFVVMIYFVFDYIRDCCWYMLENWSLIEIAVWNAKNVEDLFLLFSEEWLLSCMFLSDKLYINQIDLSNQVV